MGFVHDDRLAGQFKLRMDLSLDLEPPLARLRFTGRARSSFGGCRFALSLSRMPQPHRFFSPTACVRPWRSPARSYQRKPCLQPAFYLLPTCLQPYACTHAPPHAHANPANSRPDTQRPLHPTALRRCGADRRTSNAIKPDDPCWCVRTRALTA
jgi:hypothetical protein